MLIPLLLLIPCLGAILLFFLKNGRVASLINIVTSTLSFVVSIFLAITIWEEGPILMMSKWFYVDTLSMALTLITTFLGVTTAVYSAKYLSNEILSERLSTVKLRYFYSLYQFFFFIATLILVSNNIGIIWVGMESATFCTVLLVTLSRSTKSLEAAWKYIIICGLGLAQALLGTILFFFATESVLPPNDALLWSEITQIRHLLSPQIIELSFVFILVGYGTKAGLVPLHNWLPDAYGESIAPVLSLLSGVLVNIALYTILRFKFVVDGSVGSGFAGHFLIGFGLLNIVVASLFMMRQREVNRLFAYSSIEHVGIICFAFGLGTPLALFAGLLHMMSHSLAKTAAFFSAGSAVQLRANNLMSQITDLGKDAPAIGWGLLLSTFALIGMPPFPIFISEILILFVTLDHQIWLVLPLLFGLLLAFSSMIFHVQRMVFGSSETSLAPTAFSSSVFPIYLHLLILTGVGLWLSSLLIMHLVPIIR